VSRLRSVADVEDAARAAGLDILRTQLP